MSTIAPAVPLASPFPAYRGLDDALLDERIEAVRGRMGSRLVILGHHYQQDGVIAHADFQGDSYQLSKSAADRADCEAIAFCGVHFMAETADILANTPAKVASRGGRRVTVVLPDMAAGCSMADMAAIDQVEDAWADLGRVIDTTDITPVTYINSAASLKAFCGRHGGIVCTSSNARDILEWSFARREKVLFFPDQHLGRNTGHRMGIPLEAMVTWDFSKPLGGLTPEAIQKARMILWKGFCSVHQVFQPVHIDRFLERHPETQVIVHPECALEICEKADVIGSTEFILKTVRAAEPGTRWLVGTELNMVNRLADEMRPRGVDVHFMSPTVCMCSTMFRTDPQHLAWILENLVQGHVVNRINVPESIAEPARLSLERMLDVA